MLSAITYNYNLVWIIGEKFSKVLTWKYHTIYATYGNWNVEYCQSAMVMKIQIIHKRNHIF